MTRAKVYARFGGDASGDHYTNVDVNARHRSFEAPCMRSCEWEIAVADRTDY
jgi:hypothetical protein